MAILGRFVLLLASHFSFTAKRSASPGLPGILPWEVGPVRWPGSRQQDVLRFEVRVRHLVATPFWTVVLHSESRVKMDGLDNDNLLAVNVIHLIYFHFNGNSISAGIP